MGPVWEANHVWLIFVLVVCWTAYPVAFASIVSTLAVPLFVAAIGIILRGTRTPAPGARTRGRRGRDLVFSLSSILTPFALGAAAGGIASGRVPVGNAQGDLVTSWLNPTSLMIGALATPQAPTSPPFSSRPTRRDRRRGAVGGLPWPGARYRRRAGAVALVSLPVIRNDARPVGRSQGVGPVRVIVSAVAEVTSARPGPAVSGGAGHLRGRGGGDHRRLGLRPRPEILRPA